MQCNVFNGLQSALALKPAPAEKLWRAKIDVALADRLAASHLVNARSSPFIPAFLASRLQLFESEGYTSMKAALASFRYPTYVNNLLEVLPC